MSTSPRPATVTSTSAPPIRVTAARWLAFLQGALAVVGGLALLAIATSAPAPGWTLAGSALLALGALWIWAGVRLGGRGSAVPTLTVLLAAVTLVAAGGASALAGLAALPATALPAATLYCLVSAGTGVRTMRAQDGGSSADQARTVVRLEKGQTPTVPPPGSLRPQPIPKAPPGHYPPPVGEPVHPCGRHAPAPPESP